METKNVTDISMQNPGGNGSGEVAMSRLAARLAALAPPPIDLSPSDIVRPQPSPAVAAALATSAAISARAAERARRSRSVVGLSLIHI